MYYQINYPSPIGSVTLASDGKNIVGLWFKGQKYYGGTIKNELTDDNDLPVFSAAKNWLDNYFNGDRPAISELPLSLIGGDFHRAVWEILCAIPYGEHTTYGDIAKKIAVTMKKPNVSARAVGGAVGHNPISIIIPCHRVIGANGNLTGYAGGIDKKIKLLQHEGASLPIKHSSLA